MLVLKEVLRQKFVSNILSAESINIVYILAKKKKTDIFSINCIFIDLPKCFIRLGWLYNQTLVYLLRDIS